jgi:hypothetical protein
MPKIEAEALKLLGRHERVLISIKTGGTDEAPQIHHRTYDRLALRRLATRKGRHAVLTPAGKRMVKRL